MQDSTDPVSRLSGTIRRPAPDILRPASHLLCLSNSPCEVIKAEHHRASATESSRLPFAEPAPTIMANARRPRTVWVDEPPNGCNPSESSPPRSNTVSADLEHAHPDPAQLESQASTRKIPQLIENPWQTYEAFIEITHARPVFLARRRTNKTELVHIQSRARQSSSIDPLLGTICQLSHTSFPALRACYHHGTRVFLVWEPVELSLSQILASKCLITESEIAAIVRPVCVDRLISRYSELTLEGPPRYQISAGPRKSPRNLERRHHSHHAVWPCQSRLVDKHNFPRRLWARKSADDGISNSGSRGQL